MQDKGLRLPSFSKIPGAVAIDLDGTLLNSQTQLSDRNRAAVEACIARGIPVIIATSRATRTIRSILGESLFDRCSLVIMNGVGWNSPATLEGYPPAMKWQDFNTAFCEAARIGLGKLGAQAVRFVSSEAQGHTLGKVIKANRDQVDAILVFRYAYELEDHLDGTYTMDVETRARMWTTHPRRTLFKYRKILSSHRFPIAEWKRDDEKGDDSAFYPIIADEEKIRIQTAIANQVVEDLANWETPEE